MMTSIAHEGVYQGEKAIWLRYGRYEAAILPEIGGNLIAFHDKERNYSFLHEPDQSEMESFKASPNVYGIPLLFPPNRFEDGLFPWNGKVHKLSINEPDRHNHLHGYVSDQPWTVLNYGSNDQESYVTVQIQVDEQHPVYQEWPFCFTLTMRYTLSSNGLSQLLSLRNDGQEELPCLLAFHTAINAPFAPGSTAQDYRVKLTIGEHWEMSDRMLPTGKFLPLTAEEELLKGEGVYPFYESLDNHYTAVPQQGRNRMELRDTKENVTLVYDVGTSYKQWMIWNNGATEGFFCPEPQINLVNAPNIDMPADQSGLFSLAPGEIWEERMRLYVLE